MRLRTIVIDDEPIALEKLKQYVGKVPYLELAGAYDTPLEALRTLAQGQADLVFTDIEMPDLNGLELIESLADPPFVVITTAHERYGVDSYRIRAVDYLVKPFGFSDFQRAATRALEYARRKAGETRIEKPSFFVKTDTRYVRINQEEILYIKGYGEYLQIHVRGQALPVVTLSSFAKIKDLLGAEFLQVHRSYIVNTDNISEVERNRIIIGNDTVIPVSDSYRNEFMEFLSDHSLKK